MDTAQKKPSEFDFGFSGLEYFTPKDYKRLFVRRKWFVVFTALILGLGTAIVTYFLPNIYRATTVILVDPRKVPESYVTSTVTSSVADRLATLRQQILSATRLGQIIDEMGLYKDLQKKKSREEIVEVMRKDIEVQMATTPSTSGDRALGAFSLSFQSRSPGEAARVTNRLASLFIEENIKAREQQVLGTAEFIDRELEEAKKDLQEKEEQIRQIKARYMAELPESQTIHLQALSALQLELRGEMEAVSRAQQQKVYFQSMLIETPSVVNLDRTGSPEVTALQTQLAQLQTQVDELRQRYGPSYPDLLKKTVELQELEKQVEEAKKANLPSKQEAKPAPARRRNPILESQIAQLDDEIRKHEERQQELKNQIAYHQSKLERIPVVEQQVGSIMRDYEVARDEYRRLLDRKFAAGLSTDLEIRQKGERFVVLDPAQVPEKPYRPNRPLINFLGLAAGLMIGLAGAIAVEVFDSSVKTEREITDQLQVPIFAEIPWLPTQRDRRRQLVRAVYAGTGSALLALAYLVLVFVTWS